MKTLLKNLYEKRSKKITKAREILDRSTKKHRALTNDERAKMDRLYCDISLLDAELEKAMKELAAEINQNQ